ncbi:MAG: hypothetical protein IPG74_10425 [Flavobacteriales bacterium]|nr:hypothetical protein [Flavobacteriales bacterium]
MKPLLLAIGILCSTFVSGQTYFYVDNIAVDPLAPTTADNISIDLVGGLSSTGAYVISTSASVVGSVCYVDGKLRRLGRTSGHRAAH